MSECNVDHSHDDVKNKFASQSEYLPKEITELFSKFLAEEHTQDILNNVFHLLKKYDLADEQDKQERNRRLELILRNV
ncbi:group-specific protein [Bacillus canaveralius]|uniref:Group-specific protein n=1 Tax=Bacillus canaveralius TaxID=1403243 RepID=A0A2N5GLK0_9BACI|nr:MULTISPECIES: group-specific protein [Bacillus]PLR82517.1 group-specific protein [Bacillus canaveralius]PLR87144.1 group-specific protein [Bacillus sp. V33-4]PLR95688.1 group-specific protein [Bacillus canaveralius]RSK45582.1 group-specific protein [Bacillus canaveralius]